MPDATTERCPSELELDRWALAGRPSDHAVPTHAASCGPCGGRLAAMQRAQAIVAPDVFARNVHDVHARADARRAAPVRPWTWLTELRARWGLAVIAATCLALVTLTLRERPPASPETATWKAGEGVVLQVVAGGAPSPGGQTLRAGVVLTFRAQVPRAGYLALVSLEQGGRVSRVLPTRGPRPTPVTPGVVTAQGGVAAATGPERVFVLFDEHPFDLDTALRDVQVAARSDLSLVTGAGMPRVVATWWFRHTEVAP